MSKENENQKSNQMSAQASDRQNGYSAKRRSVKLIVMEITTLPLLFACAIITFFAGWTLERGLREQVLIGLQSAATGALLSLDNVSMESFHLVGNDLYKGDFNVSQNMGGLDYYAESNDVELTFFYGDKRRATTIKDANGKRILETSADSAVSAAVLQKGEVYSSSNVIINNEAYYGYYMPISDSDGKIIGMAFAGRRKDHVISYMWSRINSIIVIAVIIYILCVIISIAVTKKRFLKPIHTLICAAGELARGNINLKIEKETNDEFGDLTDSFAALKDNIGRQAHVAEEMAGGDLTIQYSPASDVDVMGHAIVRMVHDNNQSLQVINKASERMAAGVREIASASNSLAQGSVEQANAIEQITASIEEISASADVNAKDANQANDLAKDMKEEAIRSNEQMQHMISAMQDINDAAENISKIMKIIDDIAAQTNIISLNASVEAARAGVHGKGFAVVAEEIRKLAAESAEAASNSADMIEDSIKKAAVGSKLAEETAVSLEGIQGSVEDMVSIINRIAEASNNQSTSVSQVNQGITQIAEVMQNNSASSEECAATSAQLSNLADELKGAVDRYKLKN